MDLGNTLANRIIPYLPRLAKRGIAVTALLNCGLNNCVYETSDPNIVIKLSDSIHEARFCHKLLNFYPLSFFPRIFQVFTLGKGINKVYFILRENLKDIKIPSSAKHSFQRFTRQCQWISQRTILGSYKEIKLAIAFLKHLAAIRSHNPWYGQQTQQIIKPYIWALKNNIELDDTVLIENWGQRNGKFMLRDLDYLI